VAPGASLISIQVTTRLENCVPGGIACLIFFESDLIRALERVLALAGPGNANRVAAVSTSVGNGRFLSQAACDTWFTPIKTAIDHLRSIQVPVIFSAGNNGYTDGLIAPACISSAVSVGATTKTDTMTWYSNRAPFLSLLAPGGDGLTHAGSVITSLPGGGFGFANGTSIAAPHVAGAWSILKQAAPGASVSQVQAALRASGATIQDAPTGRGYPRLNINTARQLLAAVASQAPGAPGRPAVLGSGNFVSLSWPAPVSGGAPSSYIVHGRLSPGGPIVASLPIGEVLSTDLTAPSGTYVVSVQAGNAFGLGPESATQVLTVPVIPPPPGAPTGLAALAAGASVHLFWTPPASGGEPVGYLLVGALSPGGPAIAGLTFEAPAWWWTVPGVPPGTYYLRLAAFNLGGVSALSNEVAVSVSLPQLPGPPVLNPPIVIGQTVNLSWARGPGETPASYIVRASASPTGPVIAGLQVNGTGLSAPGVPRGQYFIVVHGVTGAGVGPPSNQVVAVVP
jgi:Subtilase family